LEVRPARASSRRSNDDAHRPEIRQVGRRHGAVTSTRSVAPLRPRRHAARGATDTGGTPERSTPPPGARNSRSASPRALTRTTIVRPGRCFAPWQHELAGADLLDYGTARSRIVLDSPRQQRRVEIGGRRSWRLASASPSVPVACAAFTTPTTTRPMPCQAVQSDRNGRSAKRI